GDTLTAPGAFDVTRRFDGIVELLADAKALRHGARVRFHQGTAEILARVALAEGAELRAGEQGFARIRLEAPAVLARGDRFVLRQYSPPITIGGGSVLDPLPSRTAIRTPSGAARLRRLAGSDAEAAAVVVEEARASGIDRAAVLR